MLKHHSDTSSADGKMTVMGRPRPGTVPPVEQDGPDPYSGSYKDPEVVDRWLEWESD